jgi:hypothetical protein
MDFIKSIWKGEQTLVFTYWIIGFLGGILLSLIISYLENIEVFNSDSGIVILLSVAFLLFFFCYTVFSLVAIWRSAGSYIATAKSDQVIRRSGSHWGYIARILVIFGWIQIIAIFVTEFS